MSETGTTTSSSFQSMLRPPCSPVRFAPAGSILDQSRRVVPGSRQGVTRTEVLWEDETYDHVAAASFAARRDSRCLLVGRSHRATSGAGAHRTHRVRSRRRG